MLSPKEQTLQAFAFIAPALWGLSISNPTVLEVANNPLGCFLQHAHMLVGSFASFGFCSHWNAFAHILLQVRVQPLFQPLLWVELWAVTEQVSCFEYRT